MGAACCADEKIVAGVQDVVVCGGRHCVVGLGGVLWICEEIGKNKDRKYMNICYICKGICLYVKVYVCMFDVDADDDDDCGIAMVRPSTITIRQTLGRGATPHSWLQNDGAEPAV